jgi:C-terminal processing protease CtpA/Prc
MYGIPLITVRKFLVSNSSDSLALAKMIGDAKKYKDAPVLIIDLRGNVGGFENYASTWISKYKGTMPNFNCAAGNLCTLTSDLASAQSRDGVPMVGTYGWKKPILTEPKRIQNKNTVFVILDSDVASAGEMFVNMLQQMDNVILVGTNTGGCLTVCNNRTLNMPYSHIGLTCGFTLFIIPNRQDFEGRGYRPDLWCPPDQAVDRVVKFVKNYGLQNSVNG